MYRFWQLNHAWVSSPRPEETEVLRVLMNGDDFVQYHDGDIFTKEEAARLCSGRFPWFHIHSPSGELIGVVALLRSNGIQAELCLHLAKPWRNQGIGTQVLERIQVIAASGMALQELYVRVLFTNKRVIPFYRRCGFQNASELPANLRIPNSASCAVLKCILSPTLVRVSIIVPMHNSTMWIQRCVKSIGPFPCEILLIDDASTDDTLITAHALAETDSRIRVLQCPSHGMAGAARNVGIREATGDYLFFLDSDDEITHPDMLQKMALYATLSQADCVMTCQYEFCKESELRIVRYPDTYTGSITPLLRPKLYARQFPIWLAWYRRTFVEEHQLRFLENVSFEDNYFSFVLASEVEGVCHVPGTLVRHFIRNQSLSHIPDVSIQTSFFRVTDLCLAYVRTHNLYLQYPNEITMWYIYAVFFTGFRIWKTMFPDEEWIVREAVCRLKHHFPKLWEKHIDERLPQSERTILRQAWYDLDNLLLAGGLNNHESL